MSKRDNRLLIVVITITSFLLRSPITEVGPVIDLIRTDLGSNSTVLGLLTTFVLVMFSVVSPLGDPIGRKLGAGQAVLLGLATLTLGILIRSFSNLTGILVGTLVLGVGIAIINVVLPALIKQEFPQKVGMVTGLFTMGMAMFSGLTSAVSRPLANTGIGWRASLAVLALLSAVCFVLWVPFRGRKILKDATGNVSWRSILCARSSWRVTILMVIQAFVFYCFIAWLPSILMERGVDPTVAGYYTFGYQLMGIPASFIIPNIAARMNHQGKLIRIIGLIYMTGLVLVIAARNTGLLLAGTLICGFSTNSLFALCMVMIPLKTKTVEESSKLSAVVQSIGYGAAAVGPLLMGALYDYYGMFVVPMCILIGMIAVIVVLADWMGKDEDTHYYPAM